MIWGRLFVAAATAMALSVPASAQFSERYEFFKAVEEENAAEVKAMAESASSTIINSKKRESGRTALHIVTEKRDASWINFLKGFGADVNVKDDAGDTPLILAASLRFTDGVQLLLAYGARVDLANNRGETPLIRAVQRADMEAVRLLLKAGANPDQADHVAGLSARDYAARDRRARRILTLIENFENEAEDKVGPAL
ncbi:ankyrin repeat domain-containing protein [Pacificimonas pallii]|nr:ankyrin repeat domain-containing protein [Pacificimonas pallii]